MSIYTNIAVKNRVPKKFILFYFILILSNIINGQVRSKAFIDHVKIDGIDTLGSFSLTVSGGTSPYTYTWTPGNIYTKDLSNVAINSYSVKIKDNASNTVNYYYNLGYKTDWFRFYATKFRNDTLMSDGSSYSGSRSAVTKNTLLPYTDGWVQFILPDYTYSDVIGFLDSTSVSNSNDVDDIDYGFHMTSTNVLYAWSNSNWTYLGTTNGGDVIRLTREGNTFNIYKNNIVMHTNSNGMQHKKLKIKITTHTDPIANLGASFKDTTYLEKLANPYAHISHINIGEYDSLGTIKLNLTTGEYPYTYKWLPNNYNTQNIIDVPFNNYTLTVKDDRNDSVVNYINLGYKAIWTKHWGTTSNNDTLFANAATTPSGSPSAFSVNELRPSTAGWIQYVMEEYNSPFVVGFADSVMAAYRGSMNDINFAFHVTTGYALYGWNGSWNYLGTTKKGDILKLEKSGTTFTLRKNNTSLFTHTANNNKNYRVKANLNNYLKLANLGVSFRDSTSSYSLKNLAFVDHAIGDGTDTLGAIKLNVSGGKSPYTYKWYNDNSTAKNRENLAIGTYTLRVKDFKGDSVKYLYNIGYRAKWSNFYGTSLRDDSLLVTTYSYPTDSFPTSRTIDSLASSTNGWSELVVRTYVAPYVIGFLDYADPNYTGTIYDIDFAFHITTGNVLYVWDRGNWYYQGSAAIGEVVRIGRNGSTYYVMRNGVNSYTNNAAPSSAIQLKVQLVGPPHADDWSYLVGTGVSWHKKCNMTATITGAPDISFSIPDNAEMICNVTGGMSPKSIIWTPGYFFSSPFTNTQFTTEVSPPSSITYTALITDLFGCKLTKTVNIVALPYAPLNIIPDGGYYKLTNNKLLFKYDGQYANTTLNYNVYDKSNANVTSQTTVSSSSVVSGDNRYYLDASNLISGQYYTFEIINEKKEKLYLRFKR